MTINNKYYHRAVYWIALNDDVVETDDDVIASQLTVIMIADVFGTQAKIVADDVIKCREAHK